MWVWTPSSWTARAFPHGQGGRPGEEGLLLKCDIDCIKSQGLPVTTPVVVSNTDDYADVVALVTGRVDLNTEILQVKA